MMNAPEVKPTLYVNTIASERAGAQTLVFIHGWGMHSGIWAQIVEQLKPAYNCLLVDLPGMGRSPIASGDYTLQSISGQVLEALEPWSNESFHWLGWSLGALVAAECARRSDQTKSLSLIAMGPAFLELETSDTSNSAINVEQPLDRMNYKIFAKFKALLSEDYEGTLFRFLGLNTKGSIHQRAEIRLLQQLVFTYGIPAQKAMREGLNILEQEQLFDVFQTPQVPTQVILGEKDALIPVQQEIWIKQNCPLVKVSVIEGAGHIPFLSRPESFLQNLQSFLVEHSL